MEFQRVQQLFDTLPSHAKKEVIDFIEFLQRRYQKSKKTKPRKMSNITEEAFVGLWENHNELKNSGKLFRELRKREWKN